MTKQKSNADESSKFPASKKKKKKKKKPRYFTPSDEKLQHLTTTKNTSSERDVFLKNRQEPSLEK